MQEAPDAEDDRATLFEDDSVSIDVLGNDADPENDGLTVTSVSRPSRGTAVLESDGTITYTPSPNYHGADNFTYTVRDDGLPPLSSSAGVIVTIESVNDPPVFPSATVELTGYSVMLGMEEVGEPVTATDTEGDLLLYRLSGSPDLEIEEHTGQITVRPGSVLDEATQPTHTVTVTADDGNGGTATVEVTIIVTSRPARPISVPIIIGPGGGGGPSGPEPSEVEFEWTVEHDIDELDEGNDRPRGSWSDGRYLYIADNAEGAGDAIYAYDLETGERVEDREFELDETNRAPRGAWSDRLTMWVSDSGQERLFAYDLETGERLEAREIVLTRRNKDARGIWSDGKTMWVLNANPSLFAYHLETGALLGEYELADENGNPHGIWSDRVTVWVSDHGAKRLLAYRLPVPPGEPPEEPLALERVIDEDFREPGRVGNNSPRGIWSDGEVMYVADENDDRVYTYNMPDAIDARLASLELSGVDFGEFSPGQTDYQGTSDEGVTEATVEVEAMQRSAVVAIDRPTPMATIRTATR